MVDSDGLETLKAHLAKLGAEAGAIDSLRYSADYGETWTVEIVIDDESSLKEILLFDDCPRCGRPAIYNGSCGHCCGDPDCETCS